MCTYCTCACTLYKDIMLEKDCLCGKADVVPFSIPISNETVCTVRNLESKH